MSINTKIDYVGLMFDFHEMDSIKHDSTFYTLFDYLGHLAYITGQLQEDASIPVCNIGRECDEMEKAEFAVSALYAE